MRPSGIRSERRSNPRRQRLRPRVRSSAARPGAGRWREDADLNGPAQRPDREAWAPRMSATAWADWLKFADSSRSSVNVVAMFRATHDVWAGDTAFAELLARLRQGSPEFVKWWE